VRCKILHVFGWRPPGANPLQSLKINNIASTGFGKRIAY
jgi:hypothetical protein